jgi:Trypsin-like peptidase domain
MLQPLMFLVGLFMLFPFGKTQAAELSNAVVYLREGANYGTGFFVQGKNSYLVTAEHVATNLRLLSPAVVRGENGSAINFTLANLVGTSGTTLAWETHTESDVAVLRVLSQGDLWEKLKTRFISLDLFEPRLGTPMRELPVTVMGFPLQLGTKGYFSPITLEAKTASDLLTLYSPEIKKEAVFYALDKPSIGGLSGGPAYLLPTPYTIGSKTFFPAGPNPAPRFVGLVHGLIQDKNGYGLALIVPSKFIVDVIRNADSK